MHQRTQNHILSSIRPPLQVWYPALQRLSWPDLLLLLSLAEWFQPEENSSPIDFLLYFWTSISSSLLLCKWTVVSVYSCRSLSLHKRWWRCCFRCSPWFLFRGRRWAAMHPCPSSGLWSLRSCLLFLVSRRCWWLGLKAVSCRWQSVLHRTCLSAQFADLVGLFSHVVYVCQNLSRLRLLSSFCWSTFLLFSRCSRKHLTAVAVIQSDSRWCASMLAVPHQKITLRWRHLLLQHRFCCFPLRLQLTLLWARSRFSFFIFADPFLLALNFWRNKSHHKPGSSEALAMPGPQVSSKSQSIYFACFSSQPIWPPSSSLWTSDPQRSSFLVILISDFISWQAFLFSDNN